MLLLFEMQQKPNHTAQMSQEEIIAALKTNDEVVMKELYTANFPKVKAFVIQNSGSSVEAKDVYQEAFIAVWQNVRGEKFIQSNHSTLSGYLYRIAKNKWLDTLRSVRHKKTISESRLHAVPENNDENVEEEANVVAEKQKEILHAIDRIGEKCKSLLQQFYYEKRNYNQIARELHMKEASVRNQKYRCMQKLRKLVLSSKN